MTPNNTTYILSLCINNCNCMVPENYGGKCWTFSYLEKRVLLDFRNFFSKYEFTKNTFCISISIGFVSTLTSKACNSGLFALCSLLKGIPRPPLKSKFLKFGSNLYTHIHDHLMIKWISWVFGVKIVGMIWEILEICFINQR